MLRKTMWGSAAVVLAALGILGCSGAGTSGTGQQAVAVDGSDTMVNLAQAWAEEYGKGRPDADIQVSGGGSGVGIASLISGMADMANSSRKMKEKEIQRAEQNTGETPVEFVVGRDALAIYVHKDNPLESISLEELEQVYGEDGEITRWSQLGIDHQACGSDEITLISRQNNSGTYVYFREAVLGKRRDYRLGTTDLSGSKDVVALVSRTPCAIGYSGMGYKTDDVKWLKVSRKKGEEGVEPSIENVRDKSYPISRPLRIYTLGEPSGTVKEYLDWIMSPEGQKVVRALGYVPLITPVDEEAVGQDSEAVSEPVEAAEPTEQTE